jgi:hypothetical protein
LARDVRAPARTGMGLQSWIERLAGAIGLDRPRVQPIYRSEETTAL